MSDDIIQLLKVHEYFRGLPESALSEVLLHARLVNHLPGAVIHETTEALTTVNFVLRGRLKGMRIGAQGAESLFRILERGEQFGMMAGALAEPIPVRVVALEPTTILSLDYEQAMELTLTQPELRRQWLKTYAGSLRKQFFGETSKRALTVLALIHSSAATRAASDRLVQRLVEIGEKLALFSDSEQSSHVPNLRFRSLWSEGAILDGSEIRGQIAQWHDVDRVLFDVDSSRGPEWLAQLLGFADRAIYFSPASDSSSAVDLLRTLDVPGRGWRDKFSVCWLLDSDYPVAPLSPTLREYVARDFKISLQPPPAHSGPLAANGLERVVHDLRGVRIGVALGGGAARGMSHLGVLKALEQNGIVVDMIAGTSAGAMTGVVYASGLDAQYAAERFADDLRPSWLFRLMPRGSQWFLLHKFRGGHFEPMLRKYLRDWKLEQLPLPCLGVTVDLVSGTSVVRERGDAVHAVLESINLPVLSVPICRDGQALVDGGLVNNIPADVLVAMGCTFVIAVSVTAKMEKEFCEIRPGASVLPRKRPSVIQTLLRSLLVQNHNLNAIGVGPAELVIEPDVTGFDLTEFVRAKELAAIGEAAALEQIPRIQQLLAQLDPQLFQIAKRA